MDIVLFDFAYVFSAMNLFNLLVYIAGLSVAFSYENLSFNKVAIQSHNGFGKGYDASNAVDGSMNTCMRARPIGYNYPEHTVWWKVDLGGVFNIYSISIFFKNYGVHYEERQRGRLAGFSLYVSKTDVSTVADIKSSTLCYKDGPQLPPLNFTTTCIEYGRYVIFYNERLNGVNYPARYEESNAFTELCEVIVQGCGKSGVFGVNCDIPCPTNCRDTVCHIQKGTCYTCKPGWTGKTCNADCKEGWYGLNCSNHCTGQCRDGLTCNHVTGQCDRGCDAGWTGSLCDKECNGGTYGYNCINNCSGHCLNEFPCNKQTGHCDKGCNPGYTNSYCSKVCPSGYFGIACRERCTGSCIRDEPCDHVSGICLSGCQDGYIGSRCNSTCRDGFYGRHCSQVCPFTCQTCRHTDGMCTCKAGWMGLRCNTECIQSYGENCLFSCSRCINHTCNRINGSCLYGCKDERNCIQGHLRMVNAHSTSSAPVAWIVGLSLSVVVNLIVISANLIKLWRTRNKGNPEIDMFCCLRSASITTPMETNDGASQYQELSVSNGNNSYQTLTLK